MRCHVHPDFSGKHFRGVAACRRALMGMARYSDGFSRPCLCYPVGGAGKIGRMRIMAAFAAGCPLKSVFLMPKIQKILLQAAFGLSGTLIWEDNKPFSIYEDRYGYQIQVCRMEEVVWKITGITMK